MNTRSDFVRNHVKADLEGNLNGGILQLRTHSNPQSACRYVCTDAWTDRRVGVHIQLLEHSKGLSVLYENRLLEEPVVNPLFLYIVPTREGADVLIEPRNLVIAGELMSELASYVRSLRHL